MRPRVYYCDNQVLPYSLKIYGAQSRQILLRALQVWLANLDIALFAVLVFCSG